jgi:hypothetical protein
MLCSANTGTGARSDHQLTCVLLTDTQPPLCSQQKVIQYPPGLPVFQVPVPEAVLGLTWAGKSLLLAVPGGYQALHPISPHPPNWQQQQQQQGAAGYQLVVLADHLSSIQPLLGCIPEQGLGLMLWEENMVLVTDASGVCLHSDKVQSACRECSLHAVACFCAGLSADAVAMRASSIHLLQQTHKSYCLVFMYVPCRCRSEGAAAAANAAHRPSRSRPLRGGPLRRWCARF